MQFLVPDDDEETAGEDGMETASEQRAGSPRVGQLETRVPSKRVRRCGGLPQAADAERAAEPAVLEAARRAALRADGSIGSPKVEEAADGRRARSQRRSYTS